MAGVGHFGCPNHFRSHFWPFQIDTQLFGCPKFTLDHISGHFRSIQIFLHLFYKMAAGGYFGCPKITFTFTFDRFSGHFRSIRNFNFFLILTKWLTSAFLDVRIHFRCHFWPFQIHTELYFFFLIFDKWPLAAILDVRR